MIKLSKSRKGAESEMWAPSDLPFWIIFGVILGFTAVFFAILLFSSGAEVTKIKEGLESYFLIDRISRSQSCFALYDEFSGRTYSGILDYNKFTDSQLGKCMIGLGRGSTAFKITLSSEGFDIPDLPKTIKTENWNDKRPTERKEQPKSILIAHSNNLQNGEMSIELQNFKE